MVSRYLRRVFMKGQGVSLSMLLLWCLLQGCATVIMVPADQLHDQRFEPDAVPIGHLYIDNWGLYLFKYIPIITGNLESAGSLRLPRLFSENVRALIFWWKR